MPQTSILQKLLQKQMTRKEFVLALAFGFVSIMGFGNILRLLTSSTGQAKPVRSTTAKPLTKTFGLGRYGGALAKRQSAVRPKVAGRNINGVFG